MIRVLSFEAYDGTNPLVKAIIALEIDDLRIYGCRLYQNAEGQRWLALPSKPARSPDGNTQWVAVVDFTSRDARVRITAEALKAIDEHAAADGTHRWWEQ
jgi:hypothetical protein